MKHLNLFFTAVFMLFAFGVTAQEASFVEKQFPGDEIAPKVVKTGVAKQSNNKTSATRTTWLANRPHDNWFISLEGGLSQLFSEGYTDYPFKDNLFPTGGLVVGKWISPVWGVRLSASGGKLASHNPDPSGLWYIGHKYQVTGHPLAGSHYVSDNEALITNRYLDKNGNSPFSYLNATVDFMLNIKNLFLPYNPKGFFNPVVYAGMGYVSTLGHKFDPFKTAKNDQVTAVPNFGVKAGLQLNFRLCDPWQLYLAADGLLVPENFDRYLADVHSYEGVGSVKLGLTYRFNFRHFIKPEFSDPDEIAALNREINELRNRPQQVCPPCPEPVVIEKPVIVEKPVSEELKPVFFSINSSTVRDSQLISVARSAEYLINHPEAKLELISYSDKQTATPPYNMQLSKKRTEAVANVLVTKFGIDKKRLILKYEGDTKQPFAENDLNRVTIFVK